MANSTIIDVHGLHQLLQERDIVVADVRFSPKEAEYGREAYQNSHVPGAVFVNFKADLTDPSEKHGGRSPLPSPERLAERLGSLGIDRSTPVVVYEDGNGPAAARLWWVLKYLGHEAVYVLDGGFSAWTDAGYPVSEDVASPVERTFVPEVQQHLLVDVETVRAAIGRDGVTLVDSRDAENFVGLASTFDPVAGHIPSAVHHFWKDGLDDDGRWKHEEAQRERFAKLSADDEIIVYCGSGISACPNVLALGEAGYRKVKLYAGSWSDWISYEGNPIATGEE